jgi:hypothetical protein
MSSRSLVQLLGDKLHAARMHTQAEETRNAAGTLVHAPGLGQILTAAYEQLRNASEYTEEHLLLQHAVRRFYTRNVTFMAHKKLSPRIGRELIIELTQAGYLKNDVYSEETAEMIQAQAEKYYQVFWDLRQHHVSREAAINWTLDILSAESEGLLNPHEYLGALAYVAFQHYKELFPSDQLVHNDQERSRYEICLYIAVHQCLLKSDLALVRHDLVKLYQQNPEDTANFAKFNEQITDLWHSKLTHKLHHAVTKYGAPLRILLNMVEERSDLPELLQDREKFLEVYDYQTAKVYGELASKLQSGLIKSVVFILITKVIIGVAIEVPYDLIVTGSIVVIPLAVNLLFPPAYMASLKLGLKNPSPKNARALHDYIDKAFFTDESPVSGQLKLAPKPNSMARQFVYTVMFLAPMVITAIILALIHFNIVQAVIFYVFVSAASFLGFRLGLMVRELELITHEHGFLATVSDFFYLPFILTGRWLSAKYAKINAVARVMDMAIEMPLKSILRIARQWAGFLNEKHDEIY